MPVATAPNPNTQTNNPNTSGGNPNVQANPNLSKLEAIRIVLTSLDNNLDAFARENAHETIADERKKGPLFKRMARNVWQTVMRDKVIVDNTNRSREEIIKSGNLRHGQGESDEEWRADAVRRYSSDYAEHMIHEEAGETFFKFDEAEAAAEGNEHIGQMRQESLDLVREYSLGNIATKDDLEQMVEDMAEVWREKGIGEKYIRGGLFLAHNIVDMAEQTKAALDARQGLSDIDKQLLLDQALRDSEFVVGEAKVGSRTEIKETTSERLAEKMRNSKWMPSSSEGTMSRVGAVLANEAVVSGVVSVGMYVAQRGFSSLASKLVPGLGAGIIAGLRERRALKEERALLERRLDNGETINEGIKAQVELEATLYESRPVGELLDELSALYDTSGNLLVTDKASFEAAVKLQGEIRARISIGDRDGARLINFSDISADKMESRRFDLDLAMAKLEVDLKDACADPAIAANVGLQQGETADDVLKAAQSAMEGLLRGEMNEKDRLFNKLVRKRALKRMLYIAGGSAAVSEVLDTIYDMFVRPTVSEVVDVRLAGNETTGGGSSDTLDNPTDVPETIKAEPAPVPETLDGKPAPAPESLQVKPAPAPESLNVEPAPAPEKISGVPTKLPDTLKGVPSRIEIPDTGESLKGEMIELSNRIKVVLPEGYKVESGGGLVKITTPEGVSFNAKLENGVLGSEGIDALRAKGFNVLYREDTIAGEPKIRNEVVSAKEYVKNHQSEMVRIKSESWYHNNTKTYDLNELGLDNQELDNGNIRVSVKGMTADGSFRGNSSVDWKEAAEDGHLKLYLSASQGTQTHVYEIPIDADGEIVIDKNSPEGRLFKNGKFIGGLERVSIKGDTTPDGKIKIATLATVVGEGREINDIVKTPTITTAHTFTIIPPTENVSSATFAPADTSLPYVAAGGRRRLGRSGGPAPSVAPNVVPPAPNVTPNSAGGGAATNPNNTPNAGTSSSTPNGSGQSTPNMGGSGNPNSQQQNSNPNQSQNPNASSAASGANPNNASGQSGAPNPNAQPNGANKPKASKTKSSSGNPNTQTGANPNNSNQTGPKPNNASASTGSNGQSSQANNPNNDPNGSKKAKGTNASNNGTQTGSSSGSSGTPNNDGGANSGNGQQAGPNQNSEQDNGGQTGGQAGAQTGPNQSGPQPNPNMSGSANYGYNFTPEERRMVNRITQDKRTMPIEFATLPFSPSMNGLSRRLVAITLHTLINASKRAPNEPYAEWRMRVVQAANAYSKQSLASLGTVSSGLRPIVQEAFEALLQATTPPPATNSGPTANASS